jgi:arabinofuranosyltransferase
LLDRRPRSPVADRARALLPVALPMAALAWAASRIWPFIEDDALISLRYARRLLEGHGLTWTDGDAVEGYSNLLWVLLSSLLGSLGIDLIVAVRILGVACIALTLVGLTLLSSGRGRPGWLPALVAGLYLCFSGPVAVWSIGGLEQPLVAALYVFALWRIAPLLGRGRIDDPTAGPIKLAALAGVPLAFLCLTRPDAPLFVATFAAVLLVARFERRAPLGGVLLAAILVSLPLAAWLGQLGFRWLAYRDWLPNPAYMKTDIRSDRVLEGLQYLADGFRHLWPFAIPAALGAAAGLYHKRDRAFTALLLVSSVLWLGYVAVIGGDHFPAHRHLLVVLVAAAALAAVGVEHLSALRRRALAVLGLLLTIAPLAVFVPLQLRDPDVEVAIISRWQWDGRVVGELFGDAFRDERPLWAVTAAGCLPYFSMLPAIDMLGLNDRHIARTAPTPGMSLSHDRGDGRYVLDRRPDLITFGLPTGKRPQYVSGRQMKRDPRFWQRYQPVRFEGVHPHRVVNLTYVRTAGRVGIRRNGSAVLYPAYLLQGDLLGQRTPGGHMGARLFAGRKVRTGELELEAGVYRVRVAPDNPLLRISLRLRSGRGAWRGDEPGSVAFTRRSRVRLDLVSPFIDTLIDRLVIEKIGTAFPRNPESGSEAEPLGPGATRIIQEPLDVGTVRGRVLRVLGRFDGDLDGWTPEGRALQSPSGGRAAPSQKPVSGFRGSLVNSFHPVLGDAATGILRSVPFVVPERAWLGLRVGGGESTLYGNRVGVRLMEDGVARQVFTGQRSEALREVRFDLAGYAGRTVWLEVFDEAERPWGHVLADEIVLRQRYR